MGVSCLLLSPTLRSIIEPVTSLFDRYLRIESKVGHAISLAELDTGINIEVHRMTFPVKGIIKCDTYLQTICSLCISALTEFQTLIVQNCFVYVLIETAFQFIYISPNCNRILYRLDKLICSFLKTAGGQGDVSKFLYLAMYYYRTCRFREALGVTAAVKSKLIQTYFLYIDRVDPEKYNGSVSGWSLSRRMEKAWANSIFWNFVLNKICAKKTEWYIYISLPMCWQTCWVCCVTTD